MWNARRRSIESVPFKRKLRICSSSCSSRCADHLKLSLVSLKTTINFQGPEILSWSIYVCVTETRCTWYGALKKFLWRTPQAQGSGFCMCKKSIMWRRGVSCKMRWLWIRFPSKGLGCPAIQFQSSSSPSASQGLITDAFTSRQWRTGSQMGGDGAVLLKHSLKVQILYALHSGDKKMAVNLLKYLGSLEDCLAIGDLMSLLEYCSKAPDRKSVV